ADNKVEIGNQAIKRTIDISDSKLHTTEVLNERIDKNLVPQKGSEDFSIHLDSEESDKKNAENTINASDLTLKETKEVDYETGKKVQFIFEDYTKNSADWSITYNVFVEDDDPYLRSNLDISSSSKEVAIDY